MNHISGFNDPLLRSSDNGKDPTGSSGSQNRLSLKNVPGRVVAPIPTLASAGGTECFGEDLDLNFILSYCDVALQAPSIGWFSGGVYTPPFLL